MSYTISQQNFLSLNEAAEHLIMSEQKLRNLCEQEQIVHYKTEKGHRRFLKEDLNIYKIKEQHNKLNEKGFFIPRGKISIDYHGNNEFSLFKYEKEFMEKYPDGIKTNNIKEIKEALEIIKPFHIHNDKSIKDSQDFQNLNMKHTNLIFDVLKEKTQHSAQTLFDCSPMLNNNVFLRFQFTFYALNENYVKNKFIEFLTEAMENISSNYEAEQGIVSFKNKKTNKIIRFNPG